MHDVRDMIPQKTVSFTCCPQNDCLGLLQSFFASYL